MFIFNDQKLVRKLDILFDRTITEFSKRCEESINKQSINFKNGLLHTPVMFSSFFLDKDAPYFYLLYRDKQKLRTLYKFDYQGKLVKIFNKLGNRFSLETKRQGLFFGRSSEDGHPVVLKEELK